MREQDLLRSVEEARQQLALLRSRLEGTGPDRLSPAVAGALAEVQERLEMLLARYGLLREVLERGSEAIFAKDHAGRYVMINAGGAELLGKSVEEIVGQDDRALLASASAARVMEVDRNVMATGKTQVFEEPFGRTEASRTLRVTVTAWNDLDGTPRGVIGSAQDVTGRRAGEREAAHTTGRLRTLATEILLAEEHLRHELAAELHNGLGQDIALTRMKLAALRTSSDATMQGEIGAIEGLVAQADRSLRAIAVRISPPTLHDLGLVSALRWLAEDLAARFGRKLVVESEPGLPELDEKTRVLTFFAVRELLLAVLHPQSAGREARVLVARAGDDLEVTVTDQGQGFDDARVGTSGLDLKEVGELVEHAGGSLELRPAPDGGASVRLRLPLAAPSARVA